LIDYIDDVIQADGGDDFLNFQRASCTLEASVKIYSCRVDSIHGDTYKMLGGLNRTDNKNGNNDNFGDDNAGDNEEAGAEGGASKKKTTSRRGISTLDLRPGAHNMKKLELECQVDPLFQRTNTAFDAGGANGLLMNRYVLLLLQVHETELLSLMCVCVFCGMKLHAVESS
jgi:condensin complex subunit 2